VSSLYRCRARVGYRPFRSDKIILFDERQIQDLSVKLKWEPNLGFSNRDNITGPNSATNALGQSRCSVTISDPYLTGIAWPALYDAASLYTASTISGAKGILLPPCGEGEDPLINKCTKFVDIDQGGGSDNEAIDPGGGFALLYISLWYNVAGTSFGTDFYFRVDGFSISHGAGYPSVTIKGTDARSVIFNQSLVNLSFDEGVEVEEAIKKIVETMGYEPQFCANTNESPEERRLIPRTIRFKGVTPDEAIRKIVNSVNGNTLSLPTQQWANKVSICARGEVQQGCTVFYLGKGLYEGYEINGTPELSLVQRNLELGLGLNNGDPYVSESFESQLYAIQDVTPNLRKEALKDVKKLPFPEQFGPISPHIQSAPRVNGFAWKDPKPAQSTNRKSVVVIHERLSNVNFFGIRPNGDQAISFLAGKVKEVDGTQGRVVIDTNFGLYICKPDDDKKCFARRIRQETSGLGEIKVRPNTEVKTGEEIGSSTAEKPEFTRFYIEGHKSEHVTLNPQIVWDWAVPQGNIQEFIASAQGEAAPTSLTTEELLTAAPPAPNLPAPSGVVGRIGSTGSSSGPHLHVEAAPRGSGLSEAQLDVLVSRYISFPGKERGRGYSGHGYPGIDYPAPSGSPITLSNGASVAEVRETKCVAQNVRFDGCGGGLGNHIVINTPEGTKLLLAHLFPESIPSDIIGLTTTSGGGKGLSSMQASPAAQGLLMETSFKGVPRALRIIPGRTILSFITNYDSWVENGGPRGRDNGTDPGIWIPARFKNWFVKTCDYKWRDGDLKVSIEGVSQWGTSQTNVPTFPEYIKSLRESGEIKSTGDYYGYIRSIGDLHWKAEEGKDSTEIGCPEAQVWAEAFSSGDDSTQPGSVQSAYPTAQCQYTGSRYPRDRVNAIINAARAGGINTKAGFAGVIGNAIIESGASLSPTAENPRSRAYGVFQWLGVRRRALEAYARSKGRSAADFGVQMEWFVQELQGADLQGRATVSSLNAQSDPSRAAFEFNRLFERAPGQKETERQQAAQEIFNGLSCS
jgi:hypothetical protein